jgi:hypothetical protein
VGPRDGIGLPWPDDWGGKSGVGFDVCWYEDCGDGIGDVSKHILQQVEVRQTTSPTMVGTHGGKSRQHGSGSSFGPLAIASMNVGAANVGVIVGGMGIVSAIGAGSIVLAVEGEETVGEGKPPFVGLDVGNAVIASATFGLRVAHTTQQTLPTQTTSPIATFCRTCVQQKRGSAWNGARLQSLSGRPNAPVGKSPVVVTGLFGPIAALASS